MKLKKTVCAVLALAMLFSALPAAAAGEGSVLTVRAVGGGFLCAQPGETPTLTVETSGAQGTVTYRWYKDWAETPIPDANGPSFTVPALKNDAEYQCEVTDRVGDKTYGETVNFRIHVDTVEYLWSDDFSECTAHVTDGSGGGETAKTEKKEKPATCTQPGLITYTAAFNNKRFYGQVKEVTIPMLWHRWSRWIQVDADNHRRVCERDAEHVQTAPHKWDNGVITIPYTDREIGEKTYTCTQCGAKRREPYGNAYYSGIAFSPGMNYITAPYGTEVELVAEAYVSPGIELTYQWYRVNSFGVPNDQTLLEGETGTHFTTPPLYYKEVYCCTAQDGTGRSATVYYQLNVDVGLVVQTPSMNYICSEAGGSVDLKVTASSLKGVNLTYRWYDDSSIEYYPGAVIDGETGPALTLSSITQNCWVACGIMDPYGGETLVQFCIDCIDFFCVVADGPSEITVPPGGIAVMKVKTLCDYGEPLVYYWCVEDPETGEFVRIPDSADAVFEAGPIEKNTRFLGCAAKKITESEYSGWNVVFTVTVDSGLTLVGGEREIIDVPYGAGTRLAMQIDINDGFQVRYAWTNAADNLIPDADSDTLYLKTVTEDGVYYCTATDVYGNSVTKPFYIRVATDIVYIWSEDLTECTAITTDGSGLTETVKTEITEKPATCTQPGLITYTAAFNNKRFYGQVREIALPIDKNNHAGGTTVVNAENALCYQDGYTGDTVCLGCGEIVQQGEVIPREKVPHAWDKGTITVKPTCSTPGTLLLRCTVKSCGATAEKEIPTDPDAHVFRVTVTEPTCVDAGYTTHACTLCRYGYSDALTDPLGHDWGEWTLTVPAAQDVPGEEARVCGRCGETETRAVEWTPPAVKLGDVDGNGEIDSADARKALRRAVDLETYEKGSDKFIACDVDRNGEVNSADARKILRAAVELEDPGTW